MNRSHSRTAEYFSDLARRHLAYGQQVLDVDVTSLRMRDITTLQAFQYLRLNSFESHIRPHLYDDDRTAQVHFSFFAFSMKISLFISDLAPLRKDIALRAI